MEEKIYQWLTFILPPVTSIITWVATRYSRKTQTLEMMQKSIDMLVEKNGKLYEELVKVRHENAELKAGQERLQNALDLSNNKIAALTRTINKEEKNKKQQDKKQASHAATAL